MEQKSKKLFEQFLFYLKSEQNVSPHTLKAYTLDLNEFLDFVFKKPKDIDNLDIYSISYFHSDQCNL